MNDTTPMPVNHHGDHPGFAGLTGTLFAAVFLLAGRAGAALAGELTSPAAGDHVVDIGCGPGNAVRAAVRRGARATGVDPSAAMLRVARTVTRDKAATWAEGSAEALPVADACATHVWALATVHHWRDVPTALTEIRRVLAPVAGCWPSSAGQNPGRRVMPAMAGRHSRPSLSRRCAHRPAWSTST